MSRQLLVCVGFTFVLCCPGIKKIWRFKLAPRGFVMKQIFLRTLLLASLLVYGGYASRTVAQSEQIAPATSDRAPLSLVFLMDASGSMQENDPLRLRKAAAQAVVSLLNPEDEVAVAEYAAEGRAISPEDDQIWFKASRQDVLFNAIEQVSDRGGYTDFYAGLRAGLALFEGVPDTRRKVILLLTDGILEPNPLDPSYAPHHLSYRLAVTGKSRAQRQAIYDEYRERLSPIARRLIADEILPVLREQEIEVYTVALGTRADRSFLKRMVDETTLHPVEVHAFEAEKATDLVAVFTQFLQYWTDKTVLKTVAGSITPGARETVFLDEFVLNPHVITLLDGQGDLSFQTEGGASEEPAPDTHQDLSIYALSKQQPPGTWLYDFRSGQGSFRMLWVGQNLFHLVLNGLKPQYRFGEPVEADVLLRIRDQPAETFIAPGTRIVATIGEAGGLTADQPVAQEAGTYRLRFEPERAGTYGLKLVAFARDRQGREILPRPSLQYQFEVLPAFFVTPEQLNFGDAAGGMMLPGLVQIHSGLRGHTTITVTGEITASSRSDWQALGAARLPGLQEIRFSVAPGSVRDERVTLQLPDEVAWGDYEGHILFTADTGERDVVDFRVHVPSLWEKVRLPLLLFLLILLIALGYLIYTWGLLKSPSGTLIPLHVPSGEVLDSIKLGQVRQGFFTRYLNWRRNRVNIGRHADIPLHQLPPELSAELSFHRWGDTYIRNRSPESSAHSIVIAESDMDRFEREPGESLVLKHNSTIELGVYTFRYENTR